MFRGIISILLITITTSLFSQDTLNYAFLDKKTYELYMAKDWENIKVYTKAALKNEIDFYYLRMRIGIAFFEQEKYRQAINHFYKALSFNEYDIIAKEYLYYSLLYSGNYGEARALSSKFSDELKIKTQVKKPKFISGMSIFLTDNFLSGTNTIDNFQTNTLDTAQGTQVITKEYRSLNFGLNHNIGSFISVYQAYSGMQKLNYSFDKQGTDQVFKDDYQINQNQYYINFNVHLLKGLKLSTSFHYLHITTPMVIISNLKKWGPPIVDSPSTSPSSSPNYTENIVIDNDYNFNIGISKNLNIISLGLNFGLSNFVENKFYQQTLNLAYYPLGNLNLYSIFEPSIIFSLEDQSNKKDFVFSEKIGVKANKKLWIEAFTTFGGIQNYTTNSGAYVYNDINKIDQQYGCNFIIPFNNFKTQIILSYSANKYTSAFQTEDGELNTLHYFTHSINGGIKWFF